MGKTGPRVVAKNTELGLVNAIYTSVCNDKRAYGQYVVNVSEDRYPRLKPRDKIIYYRKEPKKDGLEKIAEATISRLLVLSTSLRAEIIIVRESSLEKTPKNQEKFYSVTRQGKPYIPLKELATGRETEYTEGKVMTSVSLIEKMKNRLRNDGKMR